MKHTTCPRCKAAWSPDECRWQQCFNLNCLWPDSATIRVSTFKPVRLSSKRTEDEILRFIQGAPDYVSRADIARCLGNADGLLNGARLAALKRLVASGKVIEYQLGYDGRGKRVYKAVKA